MNRRDLLKALLATPLAATFDYERLLWVPGQMVTVPGMPAKAWDPETGIAIRYLDSWDISPDFYPERWDYWLEGATIHRRAKNTLTTPQQIGKELAAVQRAALSASA